MTSQNDQGPAQLDACDRGDAPSEELPAQARLQDEPAAALEQGLGPDDVSGYALAPSNITGPVSPSLPNFQIQWQPQAGPVNDPAHPGIPHFGR